MKVVFVAFTVFFTSLQIRAQETTVDKDAAYAKTVATRAEKIVTALQLSDQKKMATVTSLIANQYIALNAVYAVRDEQLKAAKENITDKAALNKKRQEIEDATTPKIQQLHDAFLKKLSTELLPEQITKIKDGLTYNVLPITYRAFQDMIPNLKPAEKDQIMAWLVEAREHAMDAESSERKHWWFGKYKGRINNYLAAQGYDLQKERQGWEARTTAAQSKANTN